MEGGDLMKYRKHIILLLGLTLFFLIGYLSKNKLNQEVLVEVTSLKYQGQVQFVSKGLDKEFKSLKPLPYGSVNENWWYMLTLSRGNKGQKFFFTKSEYLYDVEKEQLFKTSIPLKEELD